MPENNITIQKLEKNLLYFKFIKILKKFFKKLLHFINSCIKI